MENIFNDDFDELEKAVIENLNGATAKDILNLTQFLQQTENDFARFGFRDKPQRGGVASVLVMRFDAVGDYMLTTPTIREIRKNYPDAYITLVVAKNLYQLAELCPYVNEVIAFNQNQHQNLSFDMVVNVTKFARENLWKRRYDVCFYLGRVTRPIRGFLTYLSGANKRIGFSFDESDKLFFNKLVTMSAEYYLHDCLIGLSLLKGAGLKVNATNMEAWYNKTDFFTAKKLLGNFGEGRIKIAAGISAGDSSRKYPVEKYLVAYKEIISLGASIIIFGGTNELDDAKFLEENLPSEFVKNFVAFKAGWRVDAAAMSLTDVYIGNDTGAQTVASALKIPVIELSRVAQDIKEFFKGKDEAQLYGPYQTHSIILRPAHQLAECREKPEYYGCRVNKPHCIAQIDPAEIVDAFQEMMYFTKNSRIEFKDFDAKKF